jgi:ribokinase
MFKDKKINFLTIGDLATDAFIKIKDAETKCDIHGEKCLLCLNFGGKIPYESVTVCDATGNASNVAIGVSKLGIKTSILSYLGDDETAKRSLKVLKKEKVNTSYVKRVKGCISNYHYVLWYKTDRTILTKHEKFPYSLPIKMKTPDWIYLTSLASNSLSYQEEIINYLKNNKEVSLIFQPGTFQIKLGVEKLKDIYANTKIFLCNLEEAQRVLNSTEEDIPTLLKMIYSLGPKIVVITNNIKGSHAYDGKDIWFVGSLPQTPVESTGAGDAFSSAFSSALILNKNIKDAMLWGAINARSVVSEIGPQKGLLTKEQLEKYFINIPENLKPKKLN